MSGYDADHYRDPCWCPDERTLYAMRLEGHTERCTQARRGWKANMQRLSEINQQKRLDEEIGRQVREAAQAVLEKAKVEG